MTLTQALGTEPQGHWLVLNLTLTLGTEPQGRWQVLTLTPNPGDRDSRPLAGP